MPGSININNHVKRTKKNKIKWKKRIKQQIWNQPKREKIDIVSTFTKLCKLYIYSFICFLYRSLSLFLHIFFFLFEWMDFCSRIVKKKTKIQLDPKRSYTSLSLLLLFSFRLFLISLIRWFLSLPFIIFSLYFLQTDHFLLFHSDFFFLSILFAVDICLPGLSSATIYIFFRVHRYRYYRKIKDLFPMKIELSKLPWTTKDHEQK